MIKVIKLDADTLHVILSSPTLFLEFFSQYGKAMASKSAKQVHWLGITVMVR